MHTNHTYATIRIWSDTLKKLRLLAALKERSMVAVLDETVSQELEQEEQRRITRKKEGITKSERC